MAIHFQYWENEETIQIKFVIHKLNSFLLFKFLENSQKRAEPFQLNLPVL